MPQFHSQRSVLPGEEIDLAGERVSDKIVAPPVSFWGAIQTSQSDPAYQTPDQGTAQTDPFSRPVPTRTTGNLLAPAPMHPSPTTPLALDFPRTRTGTLTGTLQADGNKLNRDRVVIRGTYKRKRDKDKPPAIVVSPARRRFFRRLRMGFLFTATLLFLIASMASLTSIGRGQSGFAPLEQVISFVSSRNGDASSIDAMRPKDAPIEEEATTTPSLPPATSDLVQEARNAATKCGISPYYFERQIRSESGFNPNAVSPAGAIGIAQFMPGTAASLGLDPWDPIASLHASACHMADLNRMYNGNYSMALAAYNAGPGNVDSAVNRCGDGWYDCLPLETQHYIVKIMG